MAISGLDAALSGLRVAQQQLNVISSNIANVSTPGYSRKILPQENSVLLGESAGVRSNPIIRNVDLNLERDLWTQVSATQSLNIKASFMNQIQEFHGATEAEVSIAAEIARLRDSFIQLTNAPDDNLLLQQAVNEAGQVAKKFNDFSALLTQMRNDVQDQMRVSVEKSNGLLQQIADLNQQIKGTAALGRSSAAMEDLRDTAIKELSAEMQITFFTRGDGVLVVQTSQGQQLADENATPLFFDPAPVGSASYYPASASGLYIGGDPAVVSTARDITETGIGGKIGAFIEIRDDTMPQYQAQLDELAHKMALRFDAQGVRLFTLPDGSIPPDTAPIPNPPGPLTPVPYVGFAATMQINSQIQNDYSLLRTSTLAGLSVQDGSSEFLRRIVEFTFGEFEYLHANGTVDLRVSGLPDTLQNVLGLNPQAQIIGTVDIRALSTGVDLNAATGNPFLPPSGPPLLDDFTISVNGGPATVIDLGTVAGLYPSPPAVSGADALVTYLNNDVFPTLGLPPGTEPVSLLNQFGQIVINSQYDLDIGVGSMGDDGLSFLGLSADSFPAESPYFSVQVGRDDIIRVSIDPGDTEITLLARLNGISGIDASIDPLTGFLNIRPGPNFGGDIRIIDGPIFSTSNNSTVQEIFGSTNPVSGVAHAAYRTANLGPSVSLRTQITTATTLVDYSQKMISSQTEDINLVDAALKDEESYMSLIERQFLDDSGVNLDEELSHLILIQTAYAAAAKTVNAIDEMFRTLLNSF